MFAASSVVGARRGREPGVEDLGELRLGGRAQAEGEHVRVVPPPRAGGGRGVAAQRRADARDLVRRDRRARPGPAADDGLLGAALDDVAGRGLGAQAQSSRSPSASAPCGSGSWPRRRSSSTTASATPVRSSAATAIRMSRVSRFGRYRRRVVDAPPEAEVLEIGRDLAAALPGALAQSAEGARRPGDGPRLPGRRAARRAVPLRRRRPRLPRPRRPRPPPHRLPRRGRRPPAAARRSRCGWARAEGRPRGARRRRRRRRQAHGPPLHRRRDAARRDRRAASGLWKDGVGDVGRPARRGDGHRRRGRPLRGALRTRRSTTLHEVYAPPARRGRRSRPTRSARSRARTCR